MLYSLYAEYGALTKHTPAMTNTAIAGAKTIDPADAAAPRAKPMHTLYIIYGVCEHEYVDETTVQFRYLHLLKTYLQTVSAFARQIVWPQL